MKYKAIIFDMDGTIVDTNSIWQTATKKLIKSKGIVLEPKEEQQLIDELHGLALIKSCEIIKDLTNVNDTVSELMSQKSQFATELYNNQLQFIDGFLAFYKKVLEHDLKTGIATNADDHTLHLTKKSLNLEKYFGKHIYNISDVNNKYKPFPDIYLHVAKQLGHPPNDCFAVEDSAHGINAAKSAGIFCIGIDTAKNKELLKNADLIVNHYDEIDLERLLNKKPKKN